MKRLIAISVVCLLAVPCLARTITVDDDGPADFQTIQEALNNSWDGDTVIVRTGTYAEDVFFNGRRVTLRSEDPDDAGVVQATVIVGAGAPSVTFDFGETGDSVLEGFTITGQGISCVGTSPTIARNVIRDCSGPGIKGADGAGPAIVNNVIESNAREGVYMCDARIEGNRISLNAGGLAFCNGVITGNVITDNGDAGGLYFCNGEVTGNVILRNYSRTHGGGFYNCGGNIRHNVIAGNRAERDGGGLYNCSQSIVSNTIVGNVAGDFGGGLYRCLGTVRNNIIAFNTATSAGGIYGPSDHAYNVFGSNGGGNLGGGATWDDRDVLADPQFATDGYWENQGTAEAGDDVWINGDYHLRSPVGRWDPQARRWVIDATSSPGIDAGYPNSDWSAELWPHGQRINAGAYGGTPQASLSPANLGQPTDLDHDGRVGPLDLQRLGRRWAVADDLLAEDFNRDAVVDFNDFAILATSWRAKPQVGTPPLPDPMTWEIPPVATDPHSIEMIATTATSTDGTGVEYYFEESFHPEFNSGWLRFGPDEQPRWVDTGLIPQTTYWYQVRARNRGNQEETQWSDPLPATTPPEDFLAPTPNPLTWEVQPNRSGTGSIRMTATEAADENGVEYQFECTSHSAYSSAWQDDRSYEVTDLPEGQYTFRVRARDKSPARNATNYSDEATVDMLPPTPNPLAWEIEPTKVRIGGGSFNYHATMTAVEATDENGPVQYYFWCTSESGFTSGWQSQRTYTVQLGGQHVFATFRVKARDAAGNETGWSSELPAL
ncbi:MAG: right-handed parallel beta-helix repeat-containing protein [Sedimentisphaerales bacterium]|nr:right-handed parallel beta-helix repeat-containing protein [Sedimentisphaerales bacterium]